mmetsp:Transcript_4098/g.10251  ORF Transcript_4098/g.10251 Transcript_4098/m.10251 type:complete len:205 (-) Transcript_4098:167-781(-)
MLHRSRCAGSRRAHALGLKSHVAGKVQPARWMIVPAAKWPASAHWASVLPIAMPYRKPPTKASPAPFVSTRSALVSVHGLPATAKVSVAPPAVAMTVASAPCVTTALRVPALGPGSAASLAAISAMSSVPHSSPLAKAAASLSLQKITSHMAKHSLSRPRRGGTSARKGAETFIVTFLFFSFACAAIAFTVARPPSCVSGKPAM